jgi:hypothetical protein
MRITQAASLDDRVTALEVQNRKLEKLVAKLFQVVPGVDNYHNTSGTSGDIVSAPPTAPSAAYTATITPAVETPAHQTAPHETDPPSSSHSVSQQSNESFEDGKTFIGSIHPSTNGVPRPISNITIRGATSLPSLPREAPEIFTLDQYITLTALLDAERAARHALEIRVTKLTHMVQMISRTTHRPDINTPTTAYVNVSTFEYDDDEDDVEPPSPSVDDDSDAFKTPGEERSGHSFGTDGEEHQDEEDDGSRKRAARTLSLGQLTLGKPKHLKQPDADVDL